MGASAETFAASGDRYLGTPYRELDCQALYERMLWHAGISLNLAGSNAWYRRIRAEGWVGTPEACKARFGSIPVGATLFILADDGGERERGYEDGLGNASHIGVYIGREDGAIHSSASRGKVCYSVFRGKTINGGWNRVGLWSRMDYGETINRILTGDPTEDEAKMQDYVVVADSGKTVRVRKQPTKKADVAGTVRVNTVVQAEPIDEGAWFRVQSGSLSGYMMGEFLRPMPEIPADGSAPQVIVQPSNAILSGGELARLCELRDECARMAVELDAMAQAVRAYRDNLADICGEG